jgi:hypothetical protein
MGCGKMKSGGTIKKVKKMALGGSATNKLNNPKAPTKPMRGGGNTKMGIYGVPNAGPTGPNIQGVNTMKKGGAIKMKKYDSGGGVGDGGKKKKKTPPEENTPITKPEVPTSKKTYKNPLMARAASYFTGKTEYQKNENPISKMSTTRTFKDGKKTRVLKTKMMSGGSLKPVPADKVGLSKLPTAVRNKMGYQKKGGTVKKK